MDVGEQLEEDQDLNYFVCTLGQAAAINVQSPHSWTTVNELIDHLAREQPDRPAVGFPVPPKSTDLLSEWGFNVYSTSSQGLPRCRRSDKWS